MTDHRTIAGVKRDEILADACQREQTAEVRRVGGEPGELLRSRLLESEPGGGESTRGDGPADGGRHADGDARG